MVDNTTDYVEEKPKSPDQILETLEKGLSTIDRLGISAAELMFRIENFHPVRLTEKNVIGLEELLLEENRFRIDSQIVRSKLWWLYNRWSDINMKTFYRLMDGFNYWNKKIFSPEEVYKIMYLEVVLPKMLDFFEGENTITNFYETGRLRREANIYAIKNSYDMYLAYQSEIIEEEDDENQKEFYFEDKYKDRIFQKVQRFNPFEGIVKVFFQDTDPNKMDDLDWILAFDMGAGWYLPMTDFNSYKYL